MADKMKIGEDEKKYYVYKHQLDKEVFYIGYGGKNRPSSFAGRSREWLKFVGDRTDDVVVTIICELDEKGLAIEIESLLIFELNPKCNIESRDPKTIPNSFVVKKSINQDKELGTRFRKHWKCLNSEMKAKLAKDSGISISYISQIANGHITNITLKTISKIIDADPRVDIEWFIESKSEEVA